MYKPAISKSWKFLNDTPQIFRFFRTWFGVFEPIKIQLDLKIGYSAANLGKSLFLYAKR
jgi:hypothetical protein